MCMQCGTEAITVLEWVTPVLNQLLCWVYWSFGTISRWRT